jgi:hypothetical protein
LKAESVLLEGKGNYYWNKKVEPGMMQDILAWIF